VRSVKPKWYGPAESHVHEVVRALRCSGLLPSSCTNATTAAAKKAFVMNAIGDVGIAISIFFMVRDVGSTDFHTVFTRGPEVWAKGGSTANWVALGLLVGAVAKSAQIPLHTWLPDAMEGPTPVSALIHAATMVTAGVYLVARTHVLFENAPNVQEAVAILGVLTLLMAGVIAIVQTDIKRIIAYSTMSQIGYMFAAVGIGAYSAGMYHLLTHAFFKALLFLGAGIVIHALANEQDVRRMGGLRAVMPRTAVLMWIGTVALIGFWPLSKDEILADSLHHGGSVGWIVFIGGLAGAALTGIYAGRLMRLVFYGEMSDFARDTFHADHGESPWVMFWPVAALAAGTVLSGFLAVGFGSVNHFGNFLAQTAPTIEPTVSQDVITTLIAWALGGAGILLVWRLYADPARVAAMRSRFQTMAIIAEAKFGWDELYDNIGYRPAVWLATTFNRVGEVYVIGGSLWLARVVVSALARATALAQSGVVRQYATVLASGAAVLAVYFLGKANL